MIGTDHASMYALRAAVVGNDCGTRKRSTVVSAVTETPNTPTPAVVAFR